MTEETGIDRHWREEGIQVSSACSTEARGGSGGSGFYYPARTEQDLSTCRHGSALIASSSSGGQNNGVTVLLSCTYEDGCSLHFVVKDRP